MKSEPSGKTPLRCPSCRSDSLTSHGKRYAVYPAGCLMILALPLAMIHQTSAPIDYECRECGAKFSRRTPIAKFCLLLIFGIILWFLISVIGFILSSPPDA